MKNVIFVDFDKIATKRYKGEFTGFDNAMLEKLAEFIAKEITVMDNTVNTNITLVTDVPEKTIISEFLKKGYDFVKDVEIKSKTKGISVANEIHNFLLENYKEVNGYVVLGSKAGHYVNIPDNKLIIIDAPNVTVDNVVLGILANEAMKEHKEKSIREEIAKVKETIAVNVKEGKQPTEGVELPEIQVGHNPHKSHKQEVQKDDVKPQQPNTPEQPSAPKQDSASKQTTAPKQGNATESETNAKETAKTKSTASKAKATK